MKFPGKRKNKHYFPVSEHGRIPLDIDLANQKNVYIVGVEQTLVDIEVNIENEFLEKYNIPKGQSVIFDDQLVDQIYSELKESKKIVGEFAGGAIGNTLHNYSVLSDDTSIVFGTICENIHVGDYAFKYICTTSSHVDFSYLMPCNGVMARAICFITPDFERTFVIGKGIMNDLSPDYISENAIKGASALLITAFLLRDETAPIFAATLKAVEYAKKHNVPIVLSMGTSFLIKEKKDFFLKFIKDNISILAMNEQEAEELVNETDSLIASQKLLELADMVLLTVGVNGLYLSGYVDKQFARKTKDKIHSKSIPEYNKFEYSRTMAKSECKVPIKIYTHINPYMGGPGSTIKNTNGAGDAALAALLHDISANYFHRDNIPNSPKHLGKYITYSSIHQISKYCNRVSYEVLKQNSPRLARGLPEKEDSLETSYWAR